MKFTNSVIYGKMLLTDYISISPNIYLINLGAQYLPISTSSIEVLLRYFIFKILMYHNYCN